MNDCPNCEYHRQRAQLWRDESYKQAGHPLPEREWVGLTDEELDALYRAVKVRLMGTYDTKDIYRAVEAKLKEKNT